MAQTGSWNGYTFEVSPNLIRSFEDDMTLKGSCETETKTKSHQKYVKRKNGDVAELSFSVRISALLGVTSVRDEALKFVKSANSGDKAYFYYGTKKLMASKLMLTSAEVTEIISLPGKPTKWVGCMVKLTFKQADNSGGGSSGSGGSKKKKRKKKSYKSSGTKSGSGAKPKVVGKLGEYAKKVIEDAKKASKEKIAGKGLAYQEGVVKKVTQTKDTGTPKSPTTGRPAGSGGAGGKVVAMTK